MSEGLTLDELLVRAVVTSTPELKLWLHDSRRWVRKVARDELRKRGLTGLAERGKKRVPDTTKETR
jgi:hypothetical protein